MWQLASIGRWCCHWIVGQNDRNQRHHQARHAFNTMFYLTFLLDYIGTNKRQIPSDKTAEFASGNVENLVHDDAIDLLFEPDQYAALKNNNSRREVWDRDLAHSSTYIVYSTNTH